ncbi:MAG TPA: short-chain dehydrogenase/reductase [Geminicoccaceae bacterium]|nr:short-chain dehydrogenase/reductase [Geminicoccaceae bacterium]
MTRKLELPGRTALVTGAARGIGLDTARRLAARGCAVALLDRDGERAAREATALGPRALALGADVADRPAMQAAVAEAAERLGGLDVVVANAGVSPPSQTLLAMDADEFDRVLAVNLAGVWHTTKAALPHVVARRGHVLLVASVYAAVNGVLAAPYAVSKAAVEALGRALRVELAQHGASAGVAYFGFIDTAMVREAFARPVIQELMPALPEALRRPVPVGRAGEAIVRGIEGRSARVTVPGWVAPLLAVRGLSPAFDRRLLGDRHVRAAIARAEGSGARPG